VVSRRILSHPLGLVLGIWCRRTPMETRPVQSRRAIVLVQHLSNAPLQFLCCESSHSIDVLTRGLEWHAAQGCIKPYGARPVACSCIDLAYSILLPPGPLHFDIVVHRASQSPVPGLRIEASVSNRGSRANFGKSSGYEVLVRYVARLPSS
jgi:hypothetical protein